MGAVYVSLRECRYLSAWHEPLVAIARSFARMTSDAADHVETELDKLTPHDDKSRQQLQVGCIHHRI